MDQKKFIILLGLPGSGKGTLAKFISPLFNIPHISTGDLFRKQRQQRTELGIKVEGYLKSGKLVPDEITVAMVEARLTEQDALNGALFDGFPRTLNQAQKLDQMLAKSDFFISEVIYLDVSEELLIQRMAGRRSCPNCGAVYHVQNNPPKIDGICDNCNSPLIQRMDETEEIVKRRIEEYRPHTQEMIKYYSDKHLLSQVNGAKPIEEIKNSILHILNPKS